MIAAYFDEQVYDGIDYSKDGIVKGEYDNCTFQNCNFSNVHASNIDFVECEFLNCNFSNTIVANSAFKFVKFFECKIIGVKFNECESFLLSLYFKGCQLSLSSFYQLNLQNTNFINSNLQEVDFTETNLSKANFDNCDLNNAIFDQTRLEKANFITAFNFSINPSENNIKKAKFSKENIIGLLESFDISID